MVINKYELMVMLHPETDDERRAEIHGRIRTEVEGADGTIVGLDDWGQKKLAYEVDGQKEGLYSVHTFTAEPDTLNEIERQLRITDEVLRFITIRPHARAPKSE